MSVNYFGYDILSLVFNPFFLFDYDDIRLILSCFFKKININAPAAQYYEDNNIVILKSMSI